MRGGMIPLGVEAHVPWHSRFYWAECECALYSSDNGNALVRLPDVFDFHAPALADNFSFVGDLATGFQIERALLEDDGHAAIFQVLLGDDSRLYFELVIADERILR